MTALDITAKGISCIAGSAFALTLYKYVFYKPAPHNHHQYRTTLFMFYQEWKDSLNEKPWLEQLTSNKQIKDYGAGTLGCAAGVALEHYIAGVISTYYQDEEV